MRLELDLAERGLILGDVLLEDIQQRFGLLRAKVDALKIVDVNVVGRGLIDHAKEQQKSQILTADLHTVGVAFPVFRDVAHLDLGLRRWRVHRPFMVKHVRPRVNRRTQVF